MLSLSWTHQGTQTAITGGGERKYNLIAVLIYLLLSLSEGQSWYGKIIVETVVL